MLCMIGRRIQNNRGSTAMNVPDRSRLVMPNDYGEETPEEKRNVWIRDHRNDNYHLRYSFHREESLTCSD